MNTAPAPELTADKAVPLLFNKIAWLAGTGQELIDSGLADKGVVIRLLRSVLCQIGTFADEAAAAVGGSTVHGSADEWTLGDEGMRAVVVIAQSRDEAAQ